MNENNQKTETFAIICFACGIAGFVLLPIIFAPIGYITSIISYYKLKEDKELKGNGLRITGAVLTTINLLYLMYQYRIGPFSN